MEKSDSQMGNLTLELCVAMKTISLHTQLGEFLLTLLAMSVITAQ